jgi:hypothetical protein
VRLKAAFLIHQNSYFKKEKYSKPRTIIQRKEPKQKGMSSNLLSGSWVFGIAFWCFGFISLVMWAYGGGGSTAASAPSRTRFCWRAVLSRATDRSMRSASLAFFSWNQLNDSCCSVW